MNPQLIDNHITFWGALRRLFLFLFVLAAAGGAAAAVYFYLPPPNCIAYAVFQIKASPEFVLSPVKSRQVLTDAVSQPEVKDCSIMRKQGDPITWLQSQLKVDFEKKEIGLELMKVSTEGNNPDELKIIVKAVTESYRKETQDHDFLPQKCVAYAVFQIKAQPAFIPAPTGDAKSEFNLYRQTQAALVKSRLVLNEAVSQPDVTALPQVRNATNSIDWLENQLKVDFKMGPELMKISIGGDNPDELKTIVTAVTEAYLKKVVNKDRAKQIARMEQLTKIYQSYEEQERHHHEKLLALAKRLATSEPNAAAVKERYIQEEIGTYRRELSQLERELLKFQSDAQVLQKATEEPADDKLVLERKKQLDELKARIGTSSNYKKTLEERLNSRVSELKDFKIDQVEHEILKAKAVQTEKMAEKLLSEIESMRPEMMGMADRVTIWEDPTAVVLRKPSPLQSLSQPISVWEEPTAVMLPEENRRLKWSLVAGLATFSIGLGSIFVFGRRSVYVIHAPVAGGSPQT